MPSHLGIFVILFLCLSVASANKCMGSAQYMIDFQGTWNNMAAGFPDNAKFSPLAGCSHNKDYTMWDSDISASEGIKLAAEKGNNSKLLDEIMMQQNQGNAYMSTEATGFKAPGEAKSYIRVSYNFSMVSLISMLVPSPDWFVGVRKINLCGEDGWKNSMTMSLQAWDAGTQNGNTFKLGDDPTNPPAKIKIITTADDTPFNGMADIKPFGSITFRRVCDGKQTYTLKFQATWTKERHPTDFPTGAHFSPLIGASHSAMFQFWTPGGMASEGVKEVAEKGSTTVLYNALMAKKNMDARYILQIVKGKNFNTPGEDTVQVEVDGAHSRVSVISMLAPSPDWFVGVDSVDLCKNAMWLDMKEESNLPPWDSGTDSGPKFTSVDQVTDPPEKISVITNTQESSFKSDEAIKSLGKLVFMRHGATPMVPSTVASTEAGTTEDSTAGAEHVKGTAGLLVAAILLALRSIF